MRALGCKTTGVGSRTAREPRKLVPHHGEPPCIPDTLGVLGNNLFLLLIVILRSRKNYHFCYGSKLPKDTCSGPSFHAGNDLGAAGALIFARAAIRIWAQCRF